MQSYEAHVVEFELDVETFGALLRGLGWEKGQDRLFERDRSGFSVESGLKEARLSQFGELSRREVMMRP